MQAFFTDPDIIAAFERHIDTVLNHRNTLTGVRYRDDPTIMAWESCNMCGVVTLGSRGTDASVAAWAEAIGSHIKKLDPHHLYVDSTGTFLTFPGVLDNPSTDLVTLEEYPHWDTEFRVAMGLGPTTADTFSKDAANITSRGKVFVVTEFGWDSTDWKTAADPQAVLDRMVSTPTSPETASGRCRRTQPTSASSRSPPTAMT